MSTAHPNLPTLPINTQPQTPKMSSRTSSSLIHVVLTSIGLPSRPTASHAAWTTLQNPLVIKVDVGTMSILACANATLPLFDSQRWARVLLGLVQERHKEFAHSADSRPRWSPLTRFVSRVQLGEADGEFCRWVNLFLRIGARTECIRQPYI